MPARAKTTRLISLCSALCLAVCGASPHASAQHDVDELPNTPRALANGPSAVPVESEPDQGDALLDNSSVDDEGAAANAPSESDTPLISASQSGAHSSTFDSSRPAEKSAKPTNTWGLVRTFGALAVVLGIVFILRSATKWLAARAPSLGSQLTAGGRAPSGVLEVLGRYPVARGQKLVLLRLDRRVLLLNQTSTGFTTLTELTDPEEVASLLTKARTDEGESIASRFTSVLRSLERDPATVPDSEVVNVGDVPTDQSHLRTPRLAMHDEHADQLIEPKIASPTGADALVERLRSIRERWA